MHTVIDFRHGEDSDLPTLDEVLDRAPDHRRINAREAFHFLFHIDEYPEMLPLAHQLVREYRQNSAAAPVVLPEALYQLAAADDGLASLPGALRKFAREYGLDQLPQHETDPRRVARQLEPVMRVSGCWLRNLSRAATAHTAVGAELSGLFSRHTMAHDASGLERIDSLGTDLLELFLSFHQSRPAWTQAQPQDTGDFAFALTLLPLSISLFPREYLPELLGLNLAWHYLGIHGCVERASLEHFLGLPLPEPVQAQLQERNEALAAGSFRAIEMLCEENGAALRPGIIARVLQGADMLAAAWSEWRERLVHEHRTPDARQAMLELIRRKAPCALGYHRDKKLGGQHIDTLLDAEQHDAEELLEHLANSPWIKPGNPERSAFSTRLVELGGPMANVFSAGEMKVVRAWIRSLEDGDGKPPAPAPQADGPRRYPLWSRADYLEESREEYEQRPCSMRELYFKLVNIEYFPDVLPVAEQFLIDRLHRCFSSLTTGERPLPARHYSDEVLERWVFDKHREQIDAYEPLEGEPRVSREAFIRSTVGLAPLLLIDGAWLQGITRPGSLHTPVGLKLFRVFYEEIGEGSAALHHANIYRELLESMGVDLPDVGDIEFAFSEHFDDDAFEVPVLWLCLSCFPRHYYPELLGTNLAVELAGLGQSYMEAHDTLKHYGYPTTFVDFHNSTDNASVGHAALAMETIRGYMAEVAEREGPHGLDQHWHRVWAGMRLTLATSSDFHWRPASSVAAPMTSAIFDSGRGEQ